ncbi:MAG TPA: putative glycolipid-binding domain-containing protein, partial [Thermoanaerobaculia bacterium]|nr:putative glycolipid-binding domain-containing protein [Thermoanaerobaculia bacterium]
MTAMALPRKDDTPPRAASGRRSGSRLIRELLWRRVDIAGIEYFRLWESAAGPRLTGTVIIADAGVPLRLKYAVACAPDWTSRGVHVALTRGAVTRHLKLTAGDGQRWWRSAEEARPVPA